MRTTATWLAACMAALLALPITGCGDESSTVAVESVALDTTTLTLEPGSEVKLTATVTPNDADNKTVTWSSSDKRVVTVDNDGWVKAVVDGEATIIAQAGDKTAECKVTVESPPAITVDSIRIDPEKLSLTVGTEMTPSVNLEWQGQVVAPEVTWWSSDFDVATVDGNGNIMALAEGTATISAQAGDITATCEVTVKPIPVVAVERVTLDKETLTRGTWEYLWKKVEPDNADDPTVTWWSSDKRVATVTSHGASDRHGDHLRAGGRHNGDMRGHRDSDTHRTHYDQPGKGHAQYRHDSKADGNGNAGQCGRQDDTMVVG